MDISVILFYQFDRGWLDKARQSVKAQNFKGTFELIEIKADKSTSENLNEGLRQSTGKYIKPLCEDDELLSNCLTDLFTEAEKGYDVVCAAAHNRNEDTHAIETSFSSIPMQVSSMADSYQIHGGTVLYRRDMLVKEGGWDESLEYAEEFDLHLRLASKGYSFRAIPKIVYMYRLHSHQKSMQGGFKDGGEYLNRKRYILRNVVDKYIGNSTRIKLLPSILP